MLAAFRDKKGFSVLFSQRTAEVTAVAPVVKGASKGREPPSAGGSRRCQRCWKAFSVVTGEKPSAYMCATCCFPICRMCRERVRGCRRWACCNCIRPLNFMRLLEKTRFGTDIAIHIIQFCDPRSERIMKSFFRRAALQMASTRRSTLLDSSRVSRGGTRLSGTMDALDLQRHLYGSKEGRPSTEEVQGTSGLRLRPTSDANTPQPHEAMKSKSLLTRTTATHRNVSPQAQPLNVSSADTPPREEGSRSVVDGVIEYSPMAGKENFTPVLVEAPPPSRYADPVEVYAVSEYSAGRATASSHVTMRNMSAFEREPVTSRTTISSIAEPRMSRTDGDTAVRLSAHFTQAAAERRSISMESVQAARSESPAPRFPAFTQYLDDMKVTVVDPPYSQLSVPLVSVSPESDILELGAKRVSPKSEVTGFDSMTPRHTMHSNRSPADLSSGKKRKKRSTSHLTPRSAQATTSYGDNHHDGTDHSVPTTCNTPPLALHYQQVPGVRLSSKDHGTVLFGIPKSGLIPRSSLGSDPRTPLLTARTRCSTGTRLSDVGPMHSRPRSSSKLIRKASRTDHVVLLTQSVNTGGKLLQRTSSSSGAFVRTASGMRFTRQATATPSMRYGRVASSAHPYGAAVGVLSAGLRGQALTRTASNSGFIRVPSANYHLLRTPSRHAGFGTPRPQGTPFMRMRSASANISYGRPHYAAPLVRSRSANAGAYIRTATAAPSRLVRSRSTNAAFTRTPTAAGATAYNTVHRPVPFTGMTYHTLQRTPSGASSRIGTPGHTTPVRTVTPAGVGTPLQRTPSSHAPVAQLVRTTPAATRLQRNVSRTPNVAASLRSPHTTTDPVSPVSAVRKTGIPALVHITPKRRAELTPSVTPTSGIVGQTPRMRVPRTATVPAATARPVVLSAAPPKVSLSGPATPKLGKPRSSVGGESHSTSFSIPAGTFKIDSLNPKTLGGVKKKACRPAAPNDVFLRLTTPRRTTPGRAGTNSQPRPQQFARTEL